jgi:hypothetical protein
MLVARTSWELRQLLYELEAYLANVPRSPEARKFGFSFSIHSLHLDDFDPSLDVEEASANQCS